MPPIRENIVWSFPRRTLFPGKIFVPRWRTKIEPAFAFSPANSLVPKYLGLLSRRFFAEPPAFLCAIRYTLSHMSIQKNASKIKWYREERVLYPLMIVLVGLGSFGLGFLAGNEERREVPVTVIPASASASSGEVVASKSGSKYHFPWCPGASQISDRNRVLFESTEAARVAGYEPVKNCKGLE